MVIAALVIGHLSGTIKSSSASSASAGPLPAITVAAPPSNPAATVPCTKVLEGLPTQLYGLDARVVVTTPPSSSSSLVEAWGNPAVLVRCGVARPKDLVPGSSALYFSATGAGGPYYDVTSSGDDEIYTTVDRAVYIEISIPTKYSSGPLPALSQIIAKALPAVCSGGVAPGTIGGTDLCDQRK